MQVKREDRGEISIYRLSGEMDLYSSQEVRERIRESLTDGRDHIILECGDMSYIDSSGIGVLISLFTTLRKKGGQLILCSLQASVQSVINFTKLTGFLKVSDSLEEALASLAAAPGATAPVSSTVKKSSHNCKGIIQDNSHPLLQTAGMYHKEFNLDLRRVRKLSQLILQKAPPRIREVNLLEQQISEIIKNAIRHGNRNDPNKKIRIWFSFAEDHAHLIVQDEGSGFRDVKDWNDFYNRKMKAFEERDFDTMMNYLSYRTEDSVESDGGNALFAAVEYWNRGVVVSDRGNTVAVKRSYNP
jgi:anti-anti-sigma factor